MITQPLITGHTSHHADIPTTRPMSHLRWDTDGTASPIHDATSTDDAETIIYAPDANGVITAFQNRRRNDRRSIMRRWDDRAAMLQATIDADDARIEDAKEQTKRAWTMLAIGYTLGLVTTIAMLVATS